jgi:hypothetical protein
VGQPVMRRDLALALLLVVWRAAAWKEWTWQGAGPGPRSSHSLVLIDDVVYLFGGRSNDIEVLHVPKTYEVSEVNGQLTFTTYDQKLVKECDGGRTFQECFNITIGLLFNDIWAYPLGECGLVVQSLLVAMGLRRVPPVVGLGLPGSRMDHCGPWSAAGGLSVLCGGAPVHAPNRAVRPECGGSRRREDHNVRRILPLLR